MPGPARSRGTRVLRLAARPCATSLRLPASKAVPRRGRGRRSSEPAPCGVSARLADARGLDADLDRNASQWPGTQAEVSIAVDPSDPGRRSRGGDEPLRRAHPRDVLARRRRLLDARARPARARARRSTTIRWSRSTRQRRRVPRADPGRVRRHRRRRRALPRRRPDLGACRSASAASAATTRSPSPSTTTPTARSSDRVYVAWKLPRGGVFVSRSLDSGATFTPPQRIEQRRRDAASISLSPPTAPCTSRSRTTRTTLDPRHALARRRRDASSRRSRPPRCAPAAYVVPPLAVHPSRDRACVGRRRPLRRAAARRRLRGAGPTTRPASAATQCPSTCGGARGLRPRRLLQPLRRRRPHLVGARRSSTTSATGEVDRYHQWIRVDRSTGAVVGRVQGFAQRPHRAPARTSTCAGRSTEARSWEPALRLSSATSRTTTCFQFGDYQSVAAEGGNTVRGLGRLSPEPDGGRDLRASLRRSGATVDRGPVIARLRRAPARIHREQPAAVSRRSGLLLGFSARTAFANSGTIWKMSPTTP